MMSFLQHQYDKYVNTKPVVLTTKRMIWYSFVSALIFFILSLPYTKKIVNLTWSKFPASITSSRIGPFGADIINSIIHFVLHYILIFF